VRGVAAALMTLLVRKYSPQRPTPPPSHTNARNPPLNPPQRSYHHTGMVSMWYAMREALAIVGEEGLEAMWARHLAAHDDLWRGLGALGLEPFVENAAERLITVNTIKVPRGVDCAALSAFAMERYSVEISGGLGPSAGKVRGWGFGVGVGGWGWGVGCKCWCCCTRH